MAQFMIHQFQHSHQGEKKGENIALGGGMLRTEFFKRHLLYMLFRSYFTFFFLPYMSIFFHKKTKNIVFKSKE